MINKFGIEKLAKEFLESKKTKTNKYRTNFVYSKYNKTLETIFEIKDSNLFEKVILANKKELELYIKKYINYLNKNNYELKSIETLSKENKEKKNI